MAESRPGAALHIHEGGHYAQPSASARAMPKGHPLEQALGWSGRYNCGSPHAGNPQWDEVINQFDPPPQTARSHHEEAVRRQQRLWFFEALLEE